MSQYLKQLDSRLINIDRNISQGISSVSASIQSGFSDVSKSMNILSDEMFNISSDFKDGLASISADNKRIENTITQNFSSISRQLELESRQLNSNIIGGFESIFKKLDQLDFHNELRSSKEYLIWYFERIYMTIEEELKNGVDMPIPYVLSSNCYNFWDFWNISMANLSSGTEFDKDYELAWSIFDENTSEITRNLFKITGDYIQLYSELHLLNKEYLSIRDTKRYTLLPKENLSFWNEKYENVFCLPSWSSLYLEQYIELIDKSDMKSLKARLDACNDAIEFYSNKAFETRSLLKNINKSLEKFLIMNDIFKNLNINEIFWVPKTEFWKYLTNNTELLIKGNNESNLSLDDKAWLANEFALTLQFEWEEEKDRSLKEIQQVEEEYFLVSRNIDELNKNIEILKENDEKNIKQREQIMKTHWHKETLISKYWLQSYVVLFLIYAIFAFESTKNIFTQIIALWFLLYAWYFIVGYIVAIFFKFDNKDEITKKIGIEIEELSKEKDILKEKCIEIHKKRLEYYWKIDEYWKYLEVPQNMMLTSLTTLYSLSEVFYSSLTQLLQFQWIKYVLQKYSTIPKEEIIRMKKEMVRTLKNQIHKKAAELDIRTKDINDVFKNVYINNWNLVNLWSFSQESPEVLQKALREFKNYG